MYNTIHHGQQVQVVIPTDEQRKAGQNTSYTVGGNGVKQMPIASASVNRTASGSPQTMPHPPPLGGKGMGSQAQAQMGGGMMMQVWFRL